MKICAVITLCILFTIASCSSDDRMSNDLVPIVENGEVIDYFSRVDLRAPTSEEMELLFINGWYNPYSRVNYCEWSDGHGGSMECASLDCGVVTHVNPNGSTSVGLACYEDDVIVSAGLWRPFD